MRFDLIVGNPPYQEMHSELGTGARAIYHNFVNRAIELNPSYISMVIPARWFTGGLALGNFTSEMLGNKHLKTLVLYENSNDIFPGTSIAGGICYFLMDIKNYYKEVLYSIIDKNDRETTVRDLSDYDIFIRNNLMLGIIQRGKSNCYMDYIVKPIAYYDIPTTYSGELEGEDNLTVISSKSTYKIDKKYIRNNSEYKKYRVFTSSITSDSSGQADEDGKFNVLGRTGILSADEIVSDTYLVIGEFDTKEEAENCISYMRTKFVRAIIKQLMVGIHISKYSFKLVPLLDFKEAWTDEKIYNKFNLNSDEIKYLNDTIN